MVPPALSRSTNSAAERRVFELLKAAPVPGAVSYHSLQLSRHDYKRMGEIDFLVVCPRGLLVLEVKGGRLARHCGVWIYTDRFGKDHRSSEGPFKQASSAMFSLERRLRDQVGPDVGAYLFGYAVVTPDTSLTVESVEWEPEDAWDEVTLAGRSGIAGAIVRSFDSWAERSPGRTLQLDADRQAAVGRVLRPDFDRVPSLRVRASELDVAMEELTTEQYGALDMLEANDRVLYEGGAGTGKTFLAVEVARREAMTARTTLVCSRPVFAAYLRSRLADTDVSVATVEELRTDRPRAGVLVVDEAQDLMNLDDLSVLDEVLEGGLGEGRWRMFLDPNRQRDLVGRFEPDSLDLLRSHGAVPAMLTRNCRNTNEIVLQTRLYTAADVGRPSAGSGPAVDFLRYDGADDQLREFDIVVARLREEVAPGQITVLSPVEMADSAIAESKEVRRGRLRSLTTAMAGSWPLDHTTFATIADFKGLENSVVVLVDLDRLRPEDEVNALYVAMTRARAQLTVLLDEQTGERLARRAAEHLEQVEGLLDVVD